jgi:sugar lactone lactonase YvrE
VSSAPGPRAIGAAALALVLIGLLARPGPAQAVTTQTLPVQFLFEVSGYMPQHPFRKPAALAVDLNRRTMYVADPGDHSVVVLSLEGVPGFLLQCGPQFEPIGLALEHDGRLLVSDQSTGGIKVFGPSGQLDTEWDVAALSGLKDARAGRLYVDKAGLLYCVDQAQCRVLVFDAQQHLKLQFGSRGGRAGQFQMPEAVATDRFNRIYVTDSVGTPVQVFDARGHFLNSAGQHGQQPGQFLGPTALWIDRFDQVWVVDTEQHQITVLDRFGFPLRQVGAFGQAQGQFYFPIALALDGLGRLFVAEREGRRVQVFTYADPLDQFCQ